MSKRKTARELMDELNADATFRAFRDDREARMLAIEIECDVLRRPVLERISKMGFECESLSDLIHKHAPLSNTVVLILLDALKDSGNERVQESYVRALAAAKESFDGGILSQLYRSTSSEGLKFAVLNTIARTHPRGITDLVEEMSSETRKTLESLGTSGNNGRSER
jgi:hypothetical protein